MNKRFIIVNDQAVEAESITKPIHQGLEHIIGKSTPEDRKYVSKVDPTLVTEMVDGVSKTHKPILVYGELLENRNHWFDSLAINGICALLGAGTTMCLYYWRIIEIFSK
jgi:hypothetical protein